MDYITIYMYMLRHPYLHTTRDVCIHRYEYNLVLLYFCLFRTWYWLHCTDGVMGHANL